MEDGSQQQPETTGQPEEVENEPREEEPEKLETRRIVIENNGLEFQPESVTVQKGRKIEFVFEKSGPAHSLRNPELAVGTQTLTAEDIDSFQVTFNENGTYSFICSVADHAQQGMNGTIVVEKAPLH